MQPINTSLDCLLSFLILGVPTLEVDWDSIQLNLIFITQTVNVMVHDVQLYKYLQMYIQCQSYNKNYRKSERDVQMFLEDRLIYTFKSILSGFLVTK